MGKLIVNGDDFGASNDINNAIIYAFKEHLISSATVMVNMPGFEKACELIKSENLYGRVGIHLNLTEGYPITEKILLCSKFCDKNGKFTNHSHRLFWLSRKERKAVEEELQAQISRLIDKKIIPTHIDSHHHYHTKWAIGKEVIRAAYKNKIKAIRISRNCGKGISKTKLAYKLLYNLYLRRHKLAKTKYFGSVNDINKTNKLSIYDAEIMVHPSLDREGNLIDTTNGKELRPLIEKIKELASVKNLSTY